MQRGQQLRVPRRAERSFEALEQRLDSKVQLGVALQVLRLPRGHRFADVAELGPAASGLVFSTAISPKNASAFSEWSLSMLRSAQHSGSRKPFSAPWASFKDMCGAIAAG